MMPDSRQGMPLGTSPLLLGSGNVLRTLTSLLMLALIPVVASWQVPQSSPAVQSADDQVYNAGSSAPAISFSLVQGGLSAGSIDDGGNVDADPLVTDIDGSDNIPGSVDDEVTLRAESPAINAGNDTALPPDKFDLDGDGNFTEPIPTDITGAARVNAVGATIVDIGAHEADAAVLAVEPELERGERGIVVGTLYPNPLSRTGSIRVVFPRTGRAQVAVFDLLGRERIVLFQSSVQAGREYVVEVDATRLETGVYFLRAAAGPTAEVAQFLVVR